MTPREVGFKEGILPSSEGEGSVKSIIITTHTIQTVRNGFISSIYIS